MASYDVASNIWQALAQGDALAALLFDGVGGYGAAAAMEGDGSLLAEEIRKARAVAADARHHDPPPPQAPPPPKERELKHRLRVGPHTIGFTH